MLARIGRTGRYGHQRSDRRVELAGPRSTVGVLRVPGRHGRVVDGHVQVGLDARVVARAERAFEGHASGDLVPTVWWRTGVPVGDPVELGRIDLADHRADLSDLTGTVRWGGQAQVTARTEKPGSPAAGARLDHWAAGGRGHPGECRQR